VQAGLAGLPAATSRVTDGCIFIDYKPVGKGANTLTV
jgi:hypothetical protein